MARPIRQDGTPYPRRRPLDWETTKRILRHRQAHRDIIKQGFVEVGHFGPWKFQQQGLRMIDCCIHPDGGRLYVKLEREH